MEIVWAQQSTICPTYLYLHMAHDYLPLRQECAIADGYCLRQLLFEHWLEGFGWGHRVSHTDQYCSVIPS